jgi:heptosyltransferase II
MTQALIIAPQWIGDAVMTEPLVRRLAARGERVTVAALPWVAPVYRAMPQVHAVLELPFAHGGLQWGARRTLARSLHGRFEVAYVCPNSFKSALLPWWAGIPKRVGYRGEARLGVLTDRLPNPGKNKRPPMVAFYSALSEESGVDADRPTLALPGAAVAQALQTLNLVQQGYYVFAPGAEFGPAKRWPASHFAALAAQLPLPVVLLGSGKEDALCQTIAQECNGARPSTPAAAADHCLNLAGRTTLDQALAVIAGAKALVSNDSGLMHVAAALGVQQVALFGSSSPLHTPPLSDAAQVIWLKQQANYQPPLDCAPCFMRECPLGHTRCLVDIAPQQVLAFLPSQH